MFCRNCGTKLEDTAKECNQCGTKVIASEVESSKNTAPIGETNVKPGVGSEEVINSNVQIATKERKKLPKYFIPAIIAVAVIAIICIFFAMQPPKYNLEKYVTISYSGYNGYGKAIAKLDNSALYQDINKKNSNSNDLSMENIGKALLIETAIQSIDLKITPNSSNLSNNDEIKIEITYNNELAKKANMQFAGKTITSKVEGLEEIQKVDIFKDVELSFSGIAPNATVNYSYNGDNSNVSNYYFELNAPQGFKNGDEIVLTYTMPDDECLRYGFIPTEKEKKFIVSGLSEYVQSYEDLTDDFLESIKSEAEDTISAYVAKNYNKNSSLTDLKLSGYNLNYVKDTNNYYYTYNDFYLIYSGIVSNSDGDFRNTKVYFPVRFSDISKNDTKISYRENSGILGSSYIDGTFYSTKGYTNPYKCYLDIREAHRDVYVSTPGGGFEEFSKYDPILELSNIDETFKESLIKEATDTVTSYKWLCCWRWWNEGSNK